jgi:DNA-binding beta-propeller fold protein YncE
MPPQAETRLAGPLAGRVQRLFCAMMLLLPCKGCATKNTAARSAAQVAHITALGIDSTGNIITAASAQFGAVLEKLSPDGHPLYRATIDSPSLCTVTAIAVDEDYIYCALRCQQQPPSPFQNQIRRFALADGKPAPFTGNTAPIPHGVIEIPASTFSATTVPQADSPLINLPLRSMDIAGDTLYLTDALSGKIRMFDTTTGLQKSDFDVHLPHAIAVDPLGQIWVAHDHDSITLYRADGYSGTTYGGFGEITSLAFGPGAALYATDSKSGQVSTLDTSLNPPKFVLVLGGKAKEGDHAPDHFFNLLSVAADAKGNLVTVDGGSKDHPARLAKWSPEKKLLWEKSASTQREPGRN